jgi:hypothetical protein
LPLQFSAPLVFIIPQNPKNTTAVVLVVSQESHPPKISDVESLLLLLLRLRLLLLLFYLGDLCFN